MDHSPAPAACGYHARGPITSVLILRCFWHSGDIEAFASDQIGSKYRYYDLDQPVVRDAYQRRQLHKRSSFISKQMTERAVTYHNKMMFIYQDELFRC